LQLHLLPPRYAGAGEEALGGAGAEEEEADVHVEPDLSAAEARKAMAGIAKMVYRFPEQFDGSTVSAANKMVAALNKFIPELSFTKQAEISNFFQPAGRLASLPAGLSPQRAQRTDDVIMLDPDAPSSDV
jgi:hypothetical protein